MFRSINHKEAPAIMSNQHYNLNELTAGQPKSKIWPALRKLIGLLPEQRGKLIGALLIMVLYSFLSMLPPALIGYTINHLVNAKMHVAGSGLSVSNGWITRLLPGTGAALVGTVCIWLAVIYILNLGAVYWRTILMGGFGQHLLYTLRNAVFNKLQELPVAFFAQNKAGDLISRINNDTDKVNQFFSQSLMQFVSSIFIITGAGIALIYFNWRLGLTVLAPAALMWIFNKTMSKWVKKRNADAAKATGNLSAEIQESLNNFKVVLAFNRRDYFRNRFAQANSGNYSSAVGAGIANNIFMPVYSFLASMGQLVVLMYGIYLITAGHFTPGFLIAYFMYSSSFYDPLRQLAALWAGFQVAIAGWDRISHLLTLQTDLVTISAEDAAAAAGQISPGGHGVHGGLKVVPAGGNGKGRGTAPLIEFRDVSFHYPNGKDVLRHNSLTMEKGKTYALVGPTGGGKTTTASLLARLYDPTGGTVLLEGRDIRTYTPGERTRKIGFILQDPILFTGTVRDNILYGNEQYKDFSDERLIAVLHESGLETLLARFDEGLATPVVLSGEGISLGQKQLIAFIRAVLREPELLILDEAT